METEIGVIYSHSQGFPEAIGSWKSQEIFLSLKLQRDLHLDFGLLASSRTMRELFSIVCKSQSLSLICYENPRKQIYLSCYVFGFRALLGESHISIIKEPSYVFGFFVEVWEPEIFSSGDDLLFIAKSCSTLCDPMDGCRQAPLSV